MDENIWLICFDFATIKYISNYIRYRMADMRQNKIKRQLAAGVLAVVCMLTAIIQPDAITVQASEKNLIENTYEDISESIDESIDGKGIEDVTEKANESTAGNIIESTNNDDAGIDIDEKPEEVSENRIAELPVDMEKMPVIRVYDEDQPQGIAVSIDQEFAERIVDFISEDVVFEWSILEGEEDAEQGSETLFNQSDDWEGYKAADIASEFDIEEEEKDGVFTNLQIVLREKEQENNLKYFIRATLKGRYENQNYLWMTTVSVEKELAEKELAEKELIEKELVEKEHIEDKKNLEEQDTEASKQDEISEEGEKSGKDEDLGGEPEIKEEPEANEEQKENAVTTDDFIVGEDKQEEIQEEDITENQIKISKIVLSKSRIIMNTGETERLTVTVVPAGIPAELEWTSNNPDIVSVDAQGVLTALNEGTAVITVSAENKTAQAEVTVQKNDAEKNHDEPMDQDGNIIPISDEVWIAGFQRESSEMVYTGNQVKQDLRIYHKGTLLKEKTDYTLTYRNNVNAAAYNSAKAPSVTITMKGQYTGSRILYYTILPKTIEEGITAEEQIVYYAKNIKIPAPVLYFGSKKLTVNKDFICDYTSLPDNYTKGDSYEYGRTYEYQVNGQGNYTGSLIIRLSMLMNQNQDFGKSSVTLDKKQYVYSGTALTTEDVQVLSVKIGKTVLDDTLYEYTVTAEGAGKGCVEVYPSEAGKEAGFRGKKKITFNVAADRNIKKAIRTDQWQESIIYSRAEAAGQGGICQKNANILCYPSENESENLVEGTDYTVRYSGNTKCGTATAVFTGIGRYTGTLKLTYKIVPKTDLYIRWKDMDAEGNPVTYYQKDGAVPSFTLLECTQDGQEISLVNKTDYTVTLRNNKKLGKMTCEINGKNNYRGYKSVTEVEVMAADISCGTLIAGDKAYSKKINSWKASVIIKDVNGRQLKAGTDYDKQLIYTYEGMEEGEVPAAGTMVYVTANGINNYAGSSITGSYYIYSKHINSLIVSIDPQVYTGKEVTLSESDIHVYLNQTARKNGEELDETCYRIAGYSNNIKAGTAKVTLQGMGEYGGQRTCGFRINKKEYSNIRVKSITLQEKEILLGLGNSRQLTAIITPEDAYNKTILWSSSNNKIAAVTPDGVVTALKEGKVTIKATSQDSGKSAVCKVTVAVIRAESFVLNASQIRQQEGTVYQLKAMEIQPEEADDSTIIWVSSNAEVASVDGKGLVSLNKAGMAVISAFTADRKFEQRCLVYVESAGETGYEGEYLTPQMFRNVKDSDDTRAFNEAVSKLNDTCNVLYVPEGIYQIDAEASIKLKSNMKLVLSQNAVLKAINNSSRNYNIICVDNISNVTISGGQIQGERYGHGNSGGEWGMGIGVYDGRNITISDVKISDCWGDGIYLGSRNENNTKAGCREITISDCNLINNRRNNLSIVCADDVTINGCAFRDANGTAPQYGIDIETNNSSNPCERIEILNSVFEGNTSAAMGIVTNANDITISGCTLKGDFINYAGTNVTVDDSQLFGETDARIGITMTDGTILNDGSEEEDVLVATFKVDKKPYTIGKYNIDDSNQMSFATRNDEISPSGIALMIERISRGTKESGYYFKISEFMEDGSSALTKGRTYRFEYDVRGSGQWGIKTDQTGWYPCVPMSDKYATGIVTYTAGSGKDTRLMLYAVDKTDGMYLAIDEIRIYEIR